VTGPVYVEGAEPGDLLEVEIVEVLPDSYGYTVQVPGFGFLRDLFPNPYMVRWTIATVGLPRRTCPAYGSPARRSWARSG
jgi:formamidase